MAPTTSHKAIFTHDDGKLSIETITSPYKPAGDQTLVRVKYSAINPADIRHAFLGLYKSSSVTGYEWMGTVVEPAHQSPFKVGQELFGLSMPAFDGNPRAYSSGAHQDYILAERTSTWPVPSDLDLTQAVALGVGLQTAADALFNVMGFGFEAAGLTGATPKDKAILIWGGASTCGHAAIQLAKAAGFSPIFATASAKNHKTLRQLGATQVFDYRDENVIEQIQEAVQKSGKKLITAFDAVGHGMGVFDPPPAKDWDLSKSTPSLARRCLSNAPEDEYRLCAVLPPPHDPAWQICLGMRLEGVQTLGIPQDPSWPGRVEAVMQFFLKNPKAFISPNVTVVSGIEEGVRQIQRVFEGVSMEKVVIEHPFA